MTKTKYHIRIYAIALLVLSNFTFAQIKLPKLISDGMVLQQDTELKIWGWASEGEEVTITFLENEYKTTANQNGKWDVKLPKITAGGPYSMFIKGSNKITINDIMVGEVWLCSGQSNMELNMKRVSPIYQEEIANCENPNIRYFEVPDKFNFKAPQNDYEYGSWIKAHPDNILKFSAVSYFYAYVLNKKYNVAVGIINAALGGSPIEAWISEESLKQFPKHYNEALKFRDDELIKNIRKEDGERSGKWYSEQTRKDLAHQSPDISWTNYEFDDSDWSNITLPNKFPRVDGEVVNGVYWFRKEFNVSSDLACKKAKLNLGRIKDADSTFINGKFVGNITYEYPPRRYSIPKGLLNKGENVIVVRVISNSGQGEFVADKPYELVIDNQKIDLAGEWKYKLSVKMDPLASQTFIRWKPLGLYNSMIAPMLNYKIKGALWYQGESNADDPVEYSELFPTLINDWRTKFNYDEMPFISVQLPNFMEANAEPSESGWAEMRAINLKSQSIPNTGFVVTIDIGEWNDIHPLNKKDVGKRLFLAANKVAYGDEELCSSGPIYKSYEIVNDKIIISFTNVCDGLMLKGEQLNEFAIAGDDGKYFWANAIIENDKVIVWSDKINNPVAVRYAWADNPDKANLYNKAGLPASPFRTNQKKQ